MRTCDEILELISADLDGELTDGERAELDEHLSRCPACSALWNDLRALHGAAAELEEAPAGFAGRVMERIAADSTQEQSGRVTAFPRKRRTPWKGWAATAAVVAVVILGAATLPGQLGNLGSTGASADCAAPEADQASSINTTASAGASAADQGGGDGVQAPTALEDAPSAFLQERTSDQAESWQEDAAAKNDSSAVTSYFAAASVYCGTLTLTGEPLPPELEDCEAQEDGQGALVYVVPADRFASCLAFLEEQQAGNYTLQQGDSTAQYGLILVKGA